MAWVAIPNLGQGVNLDATGEELGSGIITSAQNMRFSAGYAERFHGIQTVYTTPPVAPYHVCNYTVGGTYYIVYAGTQRTFVDDGTTQTEITLANNTGGINDRWSGFVFQGVYIQNNGVDIPQYWGGDIGGKLANLTAWPATYRVGWMRPYKSYLFGGDVTISGNRQRSTLTWSSSADPGSLPATWDITDATKDAGQTSLAETNGTLIDAMPLGDIMVIYKDDAIHFAQTVQSSYVFRFGRLPGDTGLLARGCVAQTPLGHVLLTPGLDLVINNGQGLQSVIQGKMKTWLAENINRQQATHSFVVQNPSTFEVLACVPTGSSSTCTKAIVWNWKEDTLTTRDLNNVTYGSHGKVSLAGSYTWANLSGKAWGTLPVGSWSDFAGTSDVSRTIFTQSTPALSMFDSTEQDNGASFTAQLERTGMHFDSPETVKMCRAVRPKIDAAAGTVVKVQLGAAMVPDASPTWQTAVDFTVGTDIAAYAIATGRFLSLRIYTTADTHWRVRSVQMDIVPMGSF
jgi:hypothetical protein